MRLCSECGTALVRDSEKRCLVCLKCGAEEQMGSGIVYSRTGPEKEKIVIIGAKERSLRTMPQVKGECPRCGNRNAYWWMVQTRKADESCVPKVHPLWSSNSTYKADSFNHFIVVGRAS